MLFCSIEDSFYSASPCLNKSHLTYFQYSYYDAYYIKAQKVRHLIKDEYSAIFEEADLILSPVAPTTAPKFGSFKTSLEMYLSDIYTISINLAGLPAISLPVDKDEDGMPVGLQFIANAYDEQTLFDGALSLEKAINYIK